MISSLKIGGKRIGSKSRIRPKEATGPNGQGKDSARLIFGVIVFLLMVAFVLYVISLEGPDSISGPVMHPNGGIDWSKS